MTLCTCAAIRSTTVSPFFCCFFFHFSEKASYLWLRLLYNDSAQLLILSGTSDFRSNQYIGVARLEIVLVAAGKP